MSLPKAHRQLLRRYLSYHQSLPGVAGMFASYWRNYMLLLVVGAAGTLLAMLIDQGGLALFLVGLIAGTFLRDLGLYRRLQQSWPVTEAIVDWDRVAALLAQDE